MKRKIIRKIATSMSIIVLGVIGASSACWASTGGIRVSLTTAKMSGTYTYGKPGHQLKIVLYGHERRSSSGEDIVSETSILNGNYTSVSAVGYPDTDYKFFKMDAFGYVDGELDAAKLNVTL